MRLIKNTTELIGIKAQNIIIFFCFFSSFIFLKTIFYTIRKQTDNDVNNPSFLLFIRNGGGRRHTYLAFKYDANKLLYRASK